MSFINVLTNRDTEVTQSYAVKRGQTFSCEGLPHLSKVGVNSGFSVLQKQSDSVILLVQHYKAVGGGGFRHCSNIQKALWLKHANAFNLPQPLFPVYSNCVLSFPLNFYIFLSRHQFLSCLHPPLALMLLPIFISFPCLIPSGPICLNSVHFHCWPHKDESKRIPLSTVSNRITLQPYIG